MSVKMKRMDMVTLWNLLSKLSQENLPGRIFKIFVAKNILTIKPEIEIIQETFKSPEGAKEFEDKKRSILLKYADRDSNGVIMFQGTNFNITVPENVTKAQAEVKILEEEYKDLVAELVELNKELDLYLQQETELNLMKVTEEGIPENINTNDLTVLIELNLMV